MQFAADEVALHELGSAVSATSREASVQAAVARPRPATRAYALAMAVAARRRLSAGNCSETGTPGSGITLGRSDRRRHPEIGLGNVSSANSTKARTLGVR